MIRKTEQRHQSGASELCLECGLCCNGVLFTDVRLKPCDDPDQLRSFGLTVRKRARSHRLMQPCSAWKETRCEIYCNRPSYCREFECRLLKRVQAGETPVASAQRTIAGAKKRAEEVRRLVRALGQNDEQLSLSVRYRQVMQKPWDLSGDKETIKLRSQLLLAVHELMQTLQRDFLL